MPRQEGFLKKTMSPKPAGTGIKARKYALLVLLASFVLGTGVAQDNVERELKFVLRRPSL
jgi:hypothetical protein